MVLAQEREVKAERLEVRLTPTAKSLLNQAAQLRHTTLSDFLVSSAMRAAEEVLVSPKVFEISTEEGWSTLMDLLDEPEPNQSIDPLIELLRSTPEKR